VIPSVMVIPMGEGIGEVRECIRSLC